MNLKDEVIENAYISVEVDGESLEPLYKSIMDVLNTLDIKVKISERPHLSLAYTVGETSLSKLEEVIDEIAEAPFLIESTGIYIIQGETFPVDYISLTVKNNDDFLYAQEFVAENCKIRTSFMGKDFIAHISLFTMEKGLESVHDDLARIIEMHSNESIAGVQFKGKSISIFNKNRELLIQRSL